MFINRMIFADAPTPRGFSVSESLKNTLYHWKRPSPIRHCLYIIYIEAKSGICATIAGDVYNNSHRFSPVQCYRRSSPVQRLSVAGSARWAELRPGAEVRRAACRCNTQAGRHRLSPVRRCSVGYHWPVAGVRPNCGQAQQGGGLKPVPNSGL
jgi:hypothetical protein